MGTHTLQLHSDGETGVCIASCSLAHPSDDPKTPRAETTRDPGEGAQLSVILQGWVRTMPSHSLLPQPPAPNPDVLFCSKPPSTQSHHHQDNLCQMPFSSNHSSVQVPKIAVPVYQIKPKRYGIFTPYTYTPSSTLGPPHSGHAHLSSVPIF